MRGPCVEPMPALCTHCGASTCPPDGARPARAAMSCSEIIFTTVGGLRGAISLILVQQVVTESSPGQEDQKVTAEVRAQGSAHA